MLNNITTKSGIKILMYAGTLPFLFAALNDVYGLFFSTVDLGKYILPYACVILSFTAGAHWGTQLSLCKPNLRYLLITSNIVALAAWLSCLITADIGMLVLTCFFIMQLYIDISLYRGNVIEQWYLRSRVAVTAIVCASLISIVTL